MVDVGAIKRLLATYFDVYGVVQVDPHTGMVDVLSGPGVSLKQSEPITQLPVQFGRVEGDFHCNQNELQSLLGAPHFVLGDFDCSQNDLTDLTGAPDHVGGHMWCTDNALVSMQGAPDHVGRMILIDYSENLPLLRCLVASSIRLYNAPAQVMEIINDPKYVGKGKAAAIACAVALTKAGFKGNARW